MTHDHHHHGPRGLAAGQFDRAMAIGVTLNVVFVVVELAAGFLAGRLAAGGGQAELERQLATQRALATAAAQSYTEKAAELEALKHEMKDLRTAFTTLQQELATARARHEAAEEKLATQKREMEELGQRFNREFELIAARILETKSQKFTEENRKNLEAILAPLDKHIGEFRSKVEEVYQKEAEQRFSLGERVQELARLNQEISRQTQDLTTALKGEAKTQGRWGEMILESILEKSGLEKGREYFLEHQLTDGEGKALRSDGEGRKMRPDAVVRYPDNRSVIIDAKVSLTAYVRAVEATDPETRQQALDEHIRSVRQHVIGLSARGYDDYEHALDFTMMFMPSEAAYVAAVQGDPELWNFAYDKRILLLSPVNLITSLKLISDLWKREQQNLNAKLIAERGAKLYDKFEAFVRNLQGVGEALEKARDRYAEAYKQLRTGNDNLVLQATKLRQLGVKGKKELPPQLVREALDEEPSDEE